MSESKTYEIICPYDCPSTCGLLAEVSEGRIQSVSNNPDHPVSCRTICQKMQHYEQSIHSPRRITVPLKRAGRKGEGRFVPITWEEAVRTITDRWKEICRQEGPQAIVPAIYSGVMSDIQRNCGDAFFHRLGASEIIKSLCSSAKGAGYESVMGETGCLDPRELSDSDFYLIWGSNLAATRIQTLTDLLNQRTSGSRKPMILLDTYANPTARFCDDVILIRSGSDGALALAMMHVLLEQGLADEEYLRTYADGYEEFRASLPQYTPEWAEQETGIPAEKITALAIAYGKASAPAIILGSGPSRHINGGMNTRLVTILSQFTGAWKVPGGGLCGCDPRGGSYVNQNLIRHPEFRQSPPRRVNINQLASALNRTGSEIVRSLYVYALNPANTVSNQNLLLKGLMREDLFTVVHERFLTDTARYADIILPATFSVEQADIYRAYGYCTLATQHKIVDAPGECKSNWDTFSLLAKGMGFTEPYFQMSEEEILSEILDHPTEIIAALPPEKQQILRQGGSVSVPFADHMRILTPTGKIQILNPDCPIPLPSYLPDDFCSTCFHGNTPLRLVAGPSRLSLNTTFTDRSDLMERRGEETLWLHPADAASRGITDGSAVIAWNDLGEVTFRAYVTDQVAPGNAISEGAYHLDQSLAGRTFNALNHERISDMGEATTLNDNAIDVRPA